jgi:GTP cyclohydrolase I
MPGIGRAQVVYRPGTRLLGLGTIARLVDACSRRLALQEAIANDVVRALMTHAGARGAYAELTLTHGCLSARGACQSRARATTFSLVGELSETEVLLALGRAAGTAG